MWNWTLIIGVLLTFHLPCLALDKKSAIEGVRQLQDRNRKKIRALDLRTEKLVRGAQLEFSDLEASVEKLKSQVQVLRTQKKELLARQNLFDQLTFEIDQNFRGGDLSRFLQKTVHKMAVLSSQQATGDNPAQWQFLTYLATALRSLSPREKNSLAFLEGYINFSTVLQPIHPERYLKLMDYSDGGSFQTAKSIDPKYVGDVIERQGLQDSPVPAQKSKLLLEAPVLQSVEILKKPVSDSETGKTL